MLLCFLKHTVPRDDKSEVGYDTVRLYNPWEQGNIFVPWIELYKSTE